MATISHSKLVFNENQLIQDNMGLVVKVAQSFNPANPSIMDEYVQAGRIGLLQALRTDKPNVRFSTLAWNNILWSILRYIKQEKTDFSLPITIDPSGTSPGKTQEDVIEDYLPSTLSEREKNVILLRKQGHTFKDIGKQFDYSKSWANYVFHSGIQKIREANKITAQN